MALSKQATIASVEDTNDGLRRRGKSPEAEEQQEEMNSKDKRKTSNVASPLGRIIYSPSPKAYHERRPSDIHRAKVFESATRVLGPMQQVAIEMKTAILACGIAVTAG